MDAFQDNALVLEMRAAMRDFARAARDFSRRFSAAIKMQSLARGFLARRAYARMLAAHQQQLRLLQARQAAALAVIAPWALTFAARSHYLRLRSACCMQLQLLEIGLAEIIVKKRCVHVCSGESVATH